jgi:DNA-binding MarR family transcriptional regulator
MIDENIFEEEVLMQIRKIMRAVELHSSSLASRYKLTTPQLIILKTLSKKGALKPGILASVVNLSHATVTGIIKRLEKKGFVNKGPDSLDRRSYLINITEQGKSVLDSMPPLLQENFISKLSALQDWEKTMVLVTLQRITSLMSAEDIEAAPVLVAGPVEASADAVTSMYKDSVNNDNENGETN